MENEKHEKNRNILTFLKALYGGLSSGFLSVTCIATDEMKGGFRTVTKWFRHQELTKMASYIESQGSKYNTYIGLNPRYEDLGLYARGDALTVSSLIAVYVDLDIKGPAHKEENLPESEEELSAFLSELPLKPSIMVNSGNGIHAYWIFNEPISLDNPEVRHQARSLAKSWEEQIIGMAYVQHGWKFDSVADIARMFRAPGTTNFKTEDHKESRVVEINSLRYSENDFLKVLPENALDIQFYDAYREDRAGGTAYDADNSDGADIAGFAMLGKGSGRELIEKCAFLKYCEDNAATLPEPSWHAAISNLALTSDGEELCHEISRPYPKYSYAETEKKYRLAMRADKPITCSFIQDRLCFDCSKYMDEPCGVRAPIGRIRKEPEEEETADDIDTPVYLDTSNDMADKNVDAQSETPFTDPKEAVAQQAKTDKSNKSSSSKDEESTISSIKWEAPIPFGTFNVPTFPVDALPEPIASYVTALAESTQTPVDMAASCSIAVMSVCLQGKYKVQAKEDWAEPVNTYILNIMEPSERKSAVETAMVKPITRYETEENEKKAPLVNKSRSERRVLEKKQRSLEEAVSKGKASQEDLDRVSQELSDFKDVNPTQLYVDDITTEKLIQVLADNDGRAAILSTEGGIFDMLSGIYTKTVNIDVMLKGYSCDPIRVERVGRANDFIANPTLTILLMAQPSVLTGLMTNSNFQGRGLTGRFLYCMPKSHVGTRKYRTKPVSQELYKAYEDKVRNLLDDEYPGFPKAIMLSKEADKMIESFSNEIEPQLKTNLADISYWAGKLVGNTVRIAGLLCRTELTFDHSQLEKHDLVVSGKTMENAIRIGRYFLAHAKAAFAILDDSKLIKDSRFVLKALIKAGIREESFNRRDVMRLCRKYKDRDEVQAILDQLAEYDYIATEPLSLYKGFGRPRAPKYYLNPAIFDNPEVMKQIEGVSNESSNKDGDKDNGSEDSNL